MAAAWRHDGERFVTSCRDHHLRIWNAASGELEQMIDGLGMQFLDVTYAPDDAMLATAGRDGDGALWKSPAAPAACRWRVTAMS